MKLNPSKKLRPSQIIWAIVIIITAFFLLRVAIWESDYYSGMEGSTRAVAVNNLEESSISADETEVTEDVKAEYSVPASHPRYLSIEKLGISQARILSLGLTSKGAFAVPTNIYDAGWYNASALPGSGGTLLLDGHNGGPTKSGIFKNLPSLNAGDIIVIENGAGDIFRYAVVDNVQVPLADSTDYMRTATKSPVEGQESVTIISCSGEWDKSAKTYNSRQFVRAVKI